MKRDFEKEKPVQEIVKCAGKKKCDEDDGKWALRHQTDIQT